MTEASGTPLASDVDPARAADETLVPAISPRMRHWFHAYTRRYVARHFTAVRVSQGGEPDIPQHRPTIVYLNHPSWWDPLIMVVVAIRYFPERAHYVPIDAEQLARYRIFAKLGFFGVERGTARGARSFLATSRAILARPGSMLWVTPEGRFADPRERDAVLRPGLAHLVRNLNDAILLPLAIEYPFWDSPRPEALVRFGSPISVEPAHIPVADWTSRLTRSLRQAQSELAVDAMSRDPSRFATLLGGASRMSGVYGLWQRLRNGVMKRGNAAG